MSDLVNTVALLNTINVVLVLVSYSLNKCINAWCRNLAKRNLTAFAEQESQSLFGESSAARYTFALLKNRLSYCLGVLISLFEKAAWTISVVIICILWNAFYENMLSADYLSLGYFCTFVILFSTVASNFSKVVVLILCGRTHNEVSLYQKGKL